MNLFRIQKGTKLYSVAYCQCPRCQSAPLFTNPNHYALKDLFKMPAACPHCGQDFQIEPGFYLGAMWVSYPLVLLLDVLFLVVGVFVLKLDLVNAFVLAAFILLLLTPLIIRFSRALFINIFVEFEQDRV
jgi:hypothetical protein